MVNVTDGKGPVGISLKVLVILSAPVGSGIGALVNTTSTAVAPSLVQSPAAVTSTSWLVGVAPWKPSGGVISVTV
jgi:hypothetical protein